jgi:formylglycine-generating enzyme required for sulfatase activity
VTIGKYRLCATASDCRLMRRWRCFVMRPGAPGPKDWVQGEYPKGQDDFSVTGISWYEAAAFAEFSGKSLPTIYHWNRTAGPFSAAYIVPASNFGSTGILPVGSKPDMSPWGNYDMAGRVKEWVWNEADPGKRYVLGGAWDEPNYVFVDPDAQSAFLRAANIGFRCVKYIEPDAVPAIAMAPMPSPRRDLTKRSRCQTNSPGLPQPLLLRQVAARCESRENARWR